MKKNLLALFCLGFIVISLIVHISMWSENQSLKNEVNYYKNNAAYEDYKFDQLAVSNRELLDKVEIFSLQAKKDEKAIKDLIEENTNLNQEISKLKDELSKTPLGYVVYKGGELNYKEDEIENLVKIVLAESKGNPVAINTNTNGTKDYGLFQINSCHVQFDKNSLLTIAGNVEAAYELYAFQGTSPWNSSKSKWDN